MTRNSYIPSHQFQMTRNLYIQFEISSDSLEEIEMKGDHIKVTKCLCPSLHLFSFYGGALSYSSNQWTPSNLQDILPLQTSETTRQQQATEKIKWQPNESPLSAG